MRTKFKGILTLLLVLVAQVAFAQEQITGTVTSPEGEPLLGATVLVDGTQRGTTTDFDGKFTISASIGETLVISYTGFTTQTISIESTTVDVQMEVDNTLEEVVVVGYTNTTRKKSNISSFQVSNEDIQDRPNASVIQRLQGQVPGLNIQTNSGQPGSNSLIQLRGPSSINGNTEPLIIMDGVPINEDIFRSIDPQDIASQTVLRDAAATAIYGNRGANGVIVIKTKAGVYETPLSVRYAAQVGFTELQDNDYDLYDARGYLRLEQRQGVGRGATLTDQEIENYDVNTDWRDVFFRTGINTVHSFQLRSGGKNVNQFTSLGYTEQEGALQGSDLQRFNVRSNINGRSKDQKLYFGTNIYLGYSKNNSFTEPENDRAGFIFFNPIFGAFNGLPYVDPNDYSSELLTGIDAFNAPNAPFVLLDNLRFNGNTEDETKIILSGNIGYNFTENFDIEYRAGMDYRNEQYLRFSPPQAALPRVRASLNGLENEGFQTESYFYDFRFNSLLRLGYDFTFGPEEKHEIISNFYTEAVDSQFESFTYTQTGLNPRTFSPGNDGGAFLADRADDDLLVPTVGSGKATYSLFSYFADVAYDYDETYGLGATIRRDASSRFGGDNKWGTFWSASARWNISEENFMQGVNWVDLLKLRVSYGSNGNDRITDGYYSALNFNRQLFVSGNGYLDNPTFVRSGIIADENLKWETVTTANLGIEYALFNSRMRGSVDFYHRKTTDLFFLNFFSGVNGSYSQNTNFGDLENRGLDFTLDYDVVQRVNPGDFGFTLHAVGNYNKNEILEINAEGGVQDNGTTVIQEGRSLNEWFLVPYAGVNPANGNLLYRDQDGNITETIDADDRRLSGKDRIPDFQGSFGFDMTYKNFFFENQWTYSTGTWNYDFNERDYFDPTSIGNYQLSSRLDNAWTPDNRVTAVPAINATNLVEPFTSDRFLRNTSFLRLRFVQFGYNFTEKLLDPIGLNSARIFINGENLLTFSEWRGSDPERAAQGLFNNYPTPLIYTIGAEINF